jgi:tol-pal system beta propeller repeat protein TolB
MHRIAALVSMLIIAAASHAAAQVNSTIHYLYNHGTGTRDWKFNLRTIGADGDNETPLTSDYPIRPPEPGFNLSMSPDGTRMTFNHRDPVTNRLDIFVSNSDASNPINLTNDRAIDQYPSWSPNGRHIAFASLRGGLADIFVINSDGGNLTQLTDNPAIDGSPAWSPDGSKIAFVSQRDGNGELYIMNADGSDQVRLTDSPEDEAFPAWSPDGAKIAHSILDPLGEAIQIRTIAADGSDLVYLTNNNSGWKAHPAWSPDGAKIAFSGEREDRSGLDIFVVNSDGSNLMQLTHSPSSALSLRPMWLPMAGPASTIVEVISWGAIKNHLR